MDYQIEDVSEHQAIVGSLQSDYYPERIQYDSKNLNKE